MNKKKYQNKKDGKNEKGAALVMVLLITSLLLIASAGLLLETSMNTANVTDVSAEEQAYYAAESGIQSTINVLRGNTQPSESPTGKRITYRDAITPSTSNKSSDPSGSIPRLSRWLNYNYTPTGTTLSDRIVFGKLSDYNPATGAAYKIEIEDPDESNSIEFTTLGKINGLTSYSTGSGINKLTIDFEEVNNVSVGVNSNPSAITLGKFKVTLGGAGGSGVIANDIRFSINVRLTKPYPASETVRGWIKAGTVTNISVGTVKFDFDSYLWSVAGSKLTIASDPLTFTPPLPVVGVTTPVAAAITIGEPRRLLLRSTGIGPRGAIKQLEAIIRKDIFNGLEAPAPITSIGSSNGFVFNPGSSAAFTYSGDDLSTDMLVPPIGIAVPGLNVDAFASYMKQTLGNNLIGYPGDVTDELPDWLQSPANTDATIERLREVADASGTLYQAGTTPAYFGNNATGSGITFVDGNVSLRGAGGGILVCTGQLTLEGGFDFKGMIIVTGANGIIRNGSGNGNIYGNIVIVPYSKTAVKDSSGKVIDYNFAALGPKYDMNGGGNSTTRFDSQSVFNGLAAVDNIVVGIADK